MAQLPRIENIALPLPHFPTAAQALIYRLWDIVSPTRLAEVLSADEATVLAAAADMGLVPSADDALFEAWLAKGYITIIRAVWHLLPYSQITRLLDWTEEKLAFILREDDFLEVKLGYTKPACEEVRWQPLTAEQQRQTARIAEVTRAALAELPPVTVQPFAFDTLFARAAADAADLPSVRDPRFGARIVYPYCALYGDTFLEKELIDASFPEDLLRAYQSLGITGVWTQAVLYKLTPFPFDKSVSAGWQQRLEGVNYLIARLKKYGLRLYLYLNEPRAMPKAFFEKHPELAGVSEGDFTALCLSKKPVQNYLADAAELLVRRAPGLGGFFTITASENLTSCHSHCGPGRPCTCPACAAMSQPEMLARVNRLLLEGARHAAPDFPLIAWSWGWPTPETVTATVDHLPEGCTVMGVSEQDVAKTVGGVETRVLDYSLSVEGPGKWALDTWRRARARGLRTQAKLQLNCTWEIAAVPCVPVFERIYRHLVRLAESGCVDDLLLSWTLGGYPSPTLKLAGAFYEKNADGSLPTLEQAYARMFGAENAARCAEALHVLSEAMDAYPFHIGVAYNAPQQVGPANLLYREPTGLQATMVCYPYDDLTGWRSIYPEEIYEEQLRQLSDEWHRGTQLLEAATADCTNITLAETLDYARVCDCHFRSMLLQCRYIRARADADSARRKAILREEKALALREAAIMAHDPAIGYESSNHYFYTRQSLLEKVLNCEQLLDEENAADHDIR